MKSIGNEITMLKDRIYALLARYSVVLDTLDIFEKGGIAYIQTASPLMPHSDRFILSGIIDRISYL